MLSSIFPPYCAEFQVVTLDGGAETRWPRRPHDELERSIKRILAAGLAVKGIALYNHHDRCLHEYRDWLEGKWALGHNLVMKKLPSRQYEKLWDAIMIPCGGPVVVDAWCGAVISQALISQAGSLV